MNPRRTAGESISPRSEGKKRAPRRGVAEGEKSSSKRKNEAKIVGERTSGRKRNTTSRGEEPKSSSEVSFVKFFMKKNFNFRQNFVFLTFFFSSVS